MAFVVSSGALQRVERPMYSPSYALQVTADQTRTYAALWRAQPELRTVVDFLGRNIAQLGLHVFRRVSDVDRERLTDHPLADVLGKPNGSTTRYRLIDATVHDRCIYDNAFWLKVRGERGEPVGLRRIPPYMVFPLGDDWLEASGYEIRGNKGKVQVPADAVVHFRGYNPDDARLGASSIESLRQILAEEWAANRYREQLWRNGARMAGYIKRPVEAPDWGKGRERFRSEWQSQYTGDGPGSGGTPILEDGMEFVPASVSPQDAQYVESRKLTREEVARSFHVPLPMVGILDHATFSNIKEQHKQLYMDCLGPWLEDFQQELELQLLPDLPDTAGVYVEFNIKAKLAGSFEDEADQLQGATGAPFMTRNEARARLNLPQIDGADELIVPLNVTVGAVPPPPVEPAPVGAAAADGVDEELTLAASGRAQVKRAPVRIKARAGQEHVDKAAETLAKFFTRQGAAVASRLGAAKSRGVKADPASVFDQDRWNGELAADLLLINTVLAGAASASTLEQLGADGFDPDIMAGWLAANASGVAEVVNTVTAGNLADALAADEPLTAVGKLFDTYVSQRAGQLALTQTASISGFGSVEAAKFAGGDEATKTWVTGKNPRKSHARMNGQTVGLHDTFSNGARWPADSDALSADDIAGCNCDLVINVP